MKVRHAKKDFKKRKERKVTPDEVIDNKSQGNIGE